MQLDILTNGDIRNSVGVLTAEIGDGPQLPGTHHAVRNANAHHEALQCPAFSALPAGYSRPVSLGVNTPPAKIGSDPFGRNGFESFTGKAPDFVQPFPGIQRALQAFHL